MSWCLIVALFISGTYGFLTDNPCDVYPSYAQAGIPKDPNNTISSTVKTNCLNGTVDWNYPRGHLMLHFPNPTSASISICIRDWLGGDVFTVVDVTDNKNDVLSPITEESFKCTTRSSSKDNVLKVTAPDDQRYMGGFYYVVKNN